MRLKRVRRFGTVGALVTAALSTSVVLTPPSASAADTWDCHGSAVKRCTDVSYDSGAFWARAKIVDASGGGNYQVKVNNVRLQRLTSSGWVNVRQADDADGWHAIRDLARTRGVNPCTWGEASFRARATFYWKGASSGSETWSANSTTSRTCD